MSAPGSEGNALARACADAMLSRDRASQGLGIAILDARPGYCKTTMTIDASMVNGHDIGHGGVTFTFADSTFAFACNSRNEPNVALQASISYIAAVRRGDVLIGEAQEQSSKGRTGVYDITVSRDDGELVALFRGVCYRVRGTVLEGTA